MPTVLQLIDTFETGGAETVFLQHANALRGSRFEPVPVLFGDGWLRRELTAAGFDPIVLSTSGSFDVALFRRLTEVVRERRINLIQTHLLASAVYGGAVGRINGIPVVSTFHGTVDWRDRRFRRTKTAILNRTLSRVVFVSERLRRAALATIPLVDRMTTVINNGVDLSRFGVGRDRRWRRALGVSDDEILVGGVGRATSVKSFGTLLRAIGLLRETDRRFAAVIVGAEDPDGDRSEHDRLLAVRRDLGLEECVRFVGFQSDVPAIMKSLDALAVTSASEGFSLTTIEAMASGTPVVATRCGGPEEIITHGRDGALIAVGAVDELAQALRGLFTQPALLERITRNARASVEARYSLEHAVGRYSSLYDRLLDPPSRGRRSTPPRSGAAGPRRTSIIQGVKKVMRSTLTAAPVAPALRVFTGGAVTVFMLHRFADPETRIEGHNPELLAQNLEFLRSRRYTIASLPSVIERWRQGESIEAGTVVFTVDDGYSDFARIGAPIFERYDCPVTTFLVTSFVDGRRWLWYDAVAHAIGDAPRGGVSITLGEISTRLVWASAEERRHRVTELVRFLKSQPTALVADSVRRLSEQRGLDLNSPPPPQFGAMSWDEARRCLGMGVTFGPHSVTHPILSHTDGELAADEIRGSWRRLSSEIPSPVPVFCYPNGMSEDFGMRERAFVREAGLHAAVAAHGGHCRRSHFERDRFALPRLAYQEDPVAFRQLVGGLELIKQSLRTGGAT